MASTPPGEDFSRFMMWNIGWAGYETLLALRGENRSPRISYLDGNVELMSPGMDHERISRRIAGLIQAFCVARDIRFEPYGSWTLKHGLEEAGAEPDECYYFGRAKPARPDLAIEVVWTSGTLNKLEIYRRLGVREVWWWKDDELSVFELVVGQYEPRERSVNLPNLDIALLADLVGLESFNDALARMAESAKR